MIMPDGTIKLTNSDIIPDTLPIHDVTSAEGLRQIADSASSTASSKGWRPEFAEACALVISEAAEAFEWWRTGSDVFINTPEEDMRGYLVRARDQRELYKPEGIASELADIIIRCGHYIDYFKAPIRDCAVAWRDLTFPEEYMEFVGLVSEIYAQRDESRFMDMVEGAMRLASSLNIDDERLNHTIAVKMFYNKFRPYRHGNKQA